MILAASLAAAASASASVVSVTVSLPSQNNYAYGNLLDEVATVATPSPPATGQVEFFMCAVGVDPCTTGGTQLGTGTLSGTPPKTDAPFPAPTPGDYCIRADYQGDGTYGPASSDGSACFTTTKGQAGLQSSPTLTDFAINEGGAADVAILFGGAFGQFPTGNVDFSMCGPLSSASGCPEGQGASLGPGQISDFGIASSNSVTPQTPGWYCFRADYAGDSNYLGASDGSGEECFVTRYASTTTLAGVSPLSLGDVATLGAVVAGDGTHGTPTGSVHFFVCGPGPGLCSSGGTDAGAGPLVSRDGNSAVAHESFTPTAPGTWCARGEYSGDAQYIDSSDSSAVGCFTVNKADTQTASTPEHASIKLGDAITDSATVTGNSVGKSPTGHFDFYICGPLPSATDCTSTANQIGGDAGLTEAPTKSTATSDQFTPNVTGTWCFLAVYSGDSNYNGSQDGSSQTECFTVAKADATTASFPVDASITLGQSTTDTVNVTGNGAVGDPGGHVDFYICGPLAGATGCTDTTNQVGGDVALNNASIPISVAGSDPFTPTAPGTWCWHAVYQGSVNYTGSDDGGNASECFTVTQANSSTQAAAADSTISLGNSTSDSATVSGNATGGTPTGSVTFSACGPGDTATACTSGGQQLGSAAQLTGGSAASPTFTPDSPGTYCFRADYGGDGNYTGSSDTTTATQCVTVTKAAATVIASPATATATLAASDRDNATVTGNATGGTPTGTVTFSICGPLTTPAGCASGGHTLGSPSAVKADGTAASPPFTPTAPGTWCFRADYSGDSNYQAAGNTSACFTTPKPNAPTATIANPQPDAIYTIGDAATLTYSCTEADGGPGIATCTGPTPSGSPLDTSTLGPHTITVTATSNDGQTGTSTATYRVIRPTNTFTVTHVHGHPNGHVTLTVHLPGPGEINVLVTDWNDNLQAHAASLLPPAAHRFVWARAHLTATHAGAYKLNIAPNAHAHQVLANPRYKIRVRVWTTFQPTNGIQGKIGVYGVPITPGAGHPRLTPKP
jgi:tellurite resistance-related uncharacterized protein